MAKKTDPKKPIRSHAPKTTVSRETLEEPITEPESDPGGGDPPAMPPAVPEGQDGAQGGKPGPPVRPKLPPEKVKVLGKEHAALIEQIQAHAAKHGRGLELDELYRKKRTLEETLRYNRKPPKD